MIFKKVYHVYMDHLIHSSIATVIAEICTFPTCTIKTNYQNTNASSIINTTKDIYSRGGIREFYRGACPAILSQVFSTTSKFVMYKYLCDRYLRRDQGWLNNRFVFGMTSGIISSLFTHPMDSIKIHLQMKESFLQQLKLVGPKLLYRGYSKTFSKISISSSLYFPLYDCIKDNTQSVQTSALLSGGISTVIIHPVDYLKTRHIYGLSIFQGYNPIKYYKGISIYLLRIVPNFMIMMTVIEWLQFK